MGENAGVVQKIRSVTLEGRHVRLELLQESHHAALCAVGLDPDLWQWIPIRITTPEEMSAYIQRALNDERQAQCYRSWFSRMNGWA